MGIAGERLAPREVRSGFAWVAPRRFLPESPWAMRFASGARVMGIAGERLAPREVRPGFTRVAPRRFFCRIRFFCTFRLAMGRKECYLVPAPMARTISVWIV